MSTKERLGPTYFYQFPHANNDEVKTGTLETAIMDYNDYAEVNDLPPVQYYERVCDELGYWLCSITDEEHEHVIAKQREALDAAIDSKNGVYPMYIWREDDLPSLIQNRILDDLENSSEFRGKLMDAYEELYGKEATDNFFSSYRLFTAKSLTAYEMDMFPDLVEEYVEEKGKDYDPSKTKKDYTAPWVWEKDPADKLMFGFTLDHLAHRYALRYLHNIVEE